MLDLGLMHNGDPSDSVGLRCCHSKAACTSKDTLSVVLQRVEDGYRRHAEVRHPCPHCTPLCTKHYNTSNIVGLLQGVKKASPLENPEKSLKRGFRGFSAPRPKSSRRVKNDYFSSIFRVFGSFSRERKRHIKL